MPNTKSKSLFFIGDTVLSDPYVAGQDKRSFRAAQSQNIFCSRSVDGTIRSVPTGLTQSQRTRARVASDASRGVTRTFARGAGDLVRWMLERAARALLW